MKRAAPMSYQEILRTLGEVLDAVASTVAVIHLTPTGARLVADRANAPEDWPLEALAAEAERQRQRRTAEGPVGTRWAERLDWQLRLVGAALDVAGPGPYTVVARPEEIFVFNAEGYHQTFRHAALERRAALAPEFRGQATTCPVCEEPESLVPILDAEAPTAPQPAPAQRDSTHRCRLCGASVRFAAVPP